MPKRRSVDRSIKYRALNAIQKGDALTDWMNRRWVVTYNSHEGRYLDLQREDRPDGTWPLLSYAQFVSNFPDFARKEVSDMARLRPSHNSSTQRVPKLKRGTTLTFTAEEVTELAKYVGAGMVLLQTKPSVTRHIKRALSRLGLPTPPGM